jgi:hypothetical protein
LYNFNNWNSTYSKNRKAIATLSEDSPRISKDKRFGGLPLKACTKSALQQLEEVLTKRTKFETLQAEINFELLKQLTANRSTRAYSFARNYATLKVCISIGIWKNTYLICPYILV